MGCSPLAVLHLEVSDLDASHVSEHLKHLGLDVTIDRATDRATFARQLQDRSYDIVFSEFHMAGFSEWEVLELARTHQPNTPFIFVSGPIGEDLAVETLKRGAADFVLKDRLAKLGPSIQRALLECEERERRRKAELHDAHARVECAQNANATTKAVSVGLLDVTERQRNEEALRSSEERYRALFTSIEQGFCAVDVLFDADGRAIDYRFLEANPVFETQTGLVDVVGKRVTELVPNLEPHWFEVYGRVAKTGESVRFNNGSAAMGRWFDVSASRVGDSEANNVAILFSDVTERKLAEQEREKLLKEVETERERLADVFQLAPSLMCVLRGPDHVVERANDRFCLLVGRADILGKTIREALPELEGQGFVELLDKVYRHGEPFMGTGVPVLLQRDPGCPLEERFIDFVYQPLRDAEGNVYGVLAQGVDLTDRKRAEDKLTTLLIEEQRYATLLERVASASRSINAVLSADSITRIVTEEAVSIIGARVGITTLTTSEECRQEVRAVRRWNRDFEVDGLEDQPIFDAALAADVCKENRPLRIPRDPNVQNGWGKLAVPLVGHGKRNIGSVQLIDRWESDFTAEDESVLVQLVAIAAVGIENAHLYEQLRKQDRRKDEFLATLAHELRNPLAPIRTGLTVLNMATSPQDAMRIRAVMERQVTHMVRLIDDLLDVSRITRGKVNLNRERVDLCYVINEAFEVSMPLIEQQRHRLIFEPNAAPVWLNADRTRMAQIVSNLLNNAAKYTPQGGTIQLDAIQENGEALIRVIDNGIGIESAMLTHVFEMFTQVDQTFDRTRGGLGIGLALVKNLVEMHGGTVSAESRGLGLGSTFTVRLPLDTSAKEDLGQEPHVTLRETVSLRVMVVDDNVDGAQTLSLLLKMAGHTTDVAFTGPDALQKAIEFKPDVIFLDIGLPGMSGYQVAQQLRVTEGLGHVKLVALTGWGTEDDRRQARDAGFDHHLTKPVDAMKLEEMLMEFATHR